jgi:TorA maturation chaperone TorD
MDTALKQDVLYSCTARASFYRFLASIYKLELTPEQIEAMASQSFPKDGAIGEGFALISEYLRHRDSGTRQDLAVDYAHTFLGAGNYDTVTAPPYESVFTSEEHILMQDARDGAVAFYRAEGLGLPLDGTTPEDHVSFEMQFMAELIDRMAKAVESNDYENAAHQLAVQSDFFAQHLANWLPDFTDAIREHCKTDFYRGIARVTDGFVEEEKATLADLQSLKEMNAA